MRVQNTKSKEFVKTSSFLSWCNIVLFSLSIKKGGLFGIAGNVVGEAAAAGLGTAGIAPILGGLGLVGAAGVGGMALMSMADCGGPFVCVAPSGQCCLVAITFRGVLCPDSCWDRRQVSGSCLSSALCYILYSFQVNITIHDDVIQYSAYYFDFYIVNSK